MHANTCCVVKFAIINMHVCICVYVCIYIQISVYTHTFVHNGEYVFLIVGSRQKSLKKSTYNLR